MINLQEIFKSKSFAPPPEILQILDEHKYPKNKLEWTPIPSKDLPTRRRSMEELMKNGQVDAEKLIAPLLGNPILDQTLRTIDVLNGCGHQCDVCLADSALPSKIFSYDSLERLFSNKDFLRMLQPDSLRFGSSGDVADHPRAGEIIAMVLEQTKSREREYKCDWRTSHN
jgi:hypothetical protein